MGNAAGTGNGTEKPSVVINIDDVGMCHGANVAYLALRRSGAVDSGSVMVPCPWFLEIAEIGAADPTLNLGVHITLTSEKRYYRWRPLTRASRASGLTDDQGFMWRRVPELRRNAHPDAVEEEMRAQIDAFLAAGMKPTHIDGHMGGVFSPEFVDRYVKLGLEYGIPTLYPATIGAYGPIHNLGQVDEEVYAGPGERLAAAGNTLAGNVLETPWHRDRPAEARYRDLFGRIGGGLNFLCLHANAPGDIEAIEPDSAQIRIDEYELLSDAAFRNRVDGMDIRRGSLKDLVSLKGN